MRAILIDPFEQKVVEIDVKPTIQGLYEVMECSEVEAGIVFPDDCLFINGDPQGNPLSDPFFSYDGSIFSGRGVILGTDEDGGAVSCTMTIKEVTPKVRWVYPVLGAGGIQFVSEVTL